MEFNRNTKRILNLAPAIQVNNYIFFKIAPFILNVYYVNF